MLFFYRKELVWVELVSRELRFLILVSVWLTFLISFCYAPILGVVMPIVNEALNFTPQMGTTYLSAFYMGYAIMVLPGGILADRIGYRYTIFGWFTRHGGHYCIDEYHW